MLRYVHASAHAPWCLWYTKDNFGDLVLTFRLLEADSLLLCLLSSVFQARWPAGFWGSLLIPLHISPRSAGIPDAHHCIPLFRALCVCVFQGLNSGCQVCKPSTFSSELSQTFCLLMFNAVMMCLD